MRAILVLAVVAMSSRVEAAPNKPCVEEATINGLWICGTPKEAPSHGGESSVRDAHYTLENRGNQPITVELTSLEVLDPDGGKLKLAIDYANFLPAPVRVTKATIAAGAKIELVIFGKGSIAKLRYHVVYRHLTRFLVDGVDFSVKASEMYFRYPNKRL